MSSPTSRKGENEPPEEIPWVAAQGFMTGVFRFGSVSILAHMILSLPHPFVFSAPTPPAHPLHATPSPTLHLLPRLHPLPTLPPSHRRILKLDLSRLPNLPGSDTAIQGLYPGWSYDPRRVYLAGEAGDGIHWSGAGPQARRAATGGAGAGESSMKDVMVEYWVM
ncbi:uncharacterized protein N7506_009422 [Penicillium brevicompactum]|uniref:uncharacterized protein n=1 Tax=Penicillium brevicompactum TaxID=5074 RepID=UPI0025418153|nr:uncharacterized protein N7506_009422 [Penicillium brevicompactum]KAJ5326320.1 hypothetical protein N7506_009422 [Penicillium brevicompactum]